jgi:transcriptional regulator with XRE-family HTH domain
VVIFFGRPGLPGFFFFAVIDATIREMPRTKPPDGHVLYALGELIAKQRMAVGLSQIDLANAVGAGRTTVMYWEMGTRAPPLERLLRIAQACGKPLSAFLAPLDTYRVAPLPADTPIRTFARRKKREEKRETL